MFVAPPVDSTIHAITFPSFQLDLNEALLIGLLLLFALVIYCQARYPVQTARVFHVPDGVHGVTATKWILFQITLLIFFLLGVWQMLNAKLK